MESLPESKSTSKEIFTGDKVDRVTIDNDCVEIFLNTGALITIRPGLIINPSSIKSYLKFDRGFWGSITDDRTI